MHEFPLGETKILSSKSREKSGSIIFRDEESIVISSVDFDVEIARDRSWDLFELGERSDAQAITDYPYPTTNVNIRNGKGWTPLMVAAYHVKSAVCEALIRAGADLRFTNLNGTTALMYAKDYCVRTGDFSLARILVTAGADVMQRDRFGRNVMEYARMQGQSAALRFFEEGVIQ